MNLDDKIDLALKDEESKVFLFEQLGTLRENILEAEKRMSKCIILILSLIAIAELINQNLITKISFFSTEIVHLKIVLIAMPCIIAYYTYLLFNQITLRSALSKLFSRIIETKCKVIYDLDLDDFLITHLSINTESIYTRGKRNKIKKLIEIFSAPFTLAFQYLPLTYCFYLLYDLHGQINHDIIFLCSFIITLVYFFRASLLLIATFQEAGGLKSITEDIYEKWIKNE